MSITVKGRPDPFSPTYNPIYFYMSSSLVGQEGFKYVLDIFSAGTSTRLGKYKLFPRPVDNYGVGDINQLLTSYVNYDFHQYNNVITGATQSYINYDVNIGEEYIQYWTFTDNIDTNPPGGDTAYTGMSGHPFVAGDYVRVLQDPGYFSDLYNGVFYVKSVTPTSVTVDLPHTISTPTNPGKMTWGDRRKTVVMSGAIYSNYVAFNGAVPHQSLIDYTSTTFTMTPSSGARFLTNLPSGYHVRTENKMYLDFHCNDGGTSFYNNYAAKITTRYGTYILINTSSYKSVQQLPVGPANITAIEGLTGSTGQIQWRNQTGTPGVFKDKCWEYSSFSNSGGNTLVSSAFISPWYSGYTGETVSFINGPDVTTAGIISTPTPTTVLLNIPFSSFTNSTGYIYQKTDYYDVVMLNASGVTTSETLRFNVDYDVTRYGNVELMFIDRLGSFIPVNFTLQQNRTINIDRQEYQTIVGGLIGSYPGSGQESPAVVGRWGFDSADRGRNVLNTTVKKSISLISNWVTEAEANYFQELYSSPVTYIKEFGKYWPVIITSNTYEVKTKKNIKNIQIKITIEMANLDMIQQF